ncbi:MAG: TIGR02302 family protein [Pseudomonadota bacterium]
MIDGQDETGSNPFTDNRLDTRELARRIERNILLARITLFWEAAVPAVLPFLSVLSAFVGVSWMGIWPVLPIALHIILLLLFAAGFVWSLRFTRHLVWPSREQARRRVETASGLSGRPLETLDDSLAVQKERTETVALWRAHRRRTLQRLGALKVGSPAPSYNANDRYAGRIFAAILLYVGAFAGYGVYGERLGDAFRFHTVAESSGLRIDAWVTPPAYTGHPPIFLDMARSTETIEPINIPEGSVVFIRSHGADDINVAHVTAGGESAIAATEPEIGTVPIPASTGSGISAPLFETREIPLETDSAVEIALGSNQVARWVFSVVEDRAPEIQMQEPPEVQLSGAVKLVYSMQDDYGVIGAGARVTPKEESFTISGETSEVRPLIEAPDFKLALPQRRTKSGSAQTFRDLTAHPWAGSLVEVVLSARDEAGQTGESEAFEFRLPTRNFSKPMARAIAEQRRNLALDANRRLQVLDAFDALLIAPERFIDDASLYLGMRFVYRQLQKADDDAALIQALDVMWDLALAIEDGDLSLAERALREAEEALRRALENGAPDEEIQRLTQELREALNEYFRALAEQMQRNPNAAAQMDPNAQTLRQQDLDEMLDRIEDLARTGAHDAAREMLSQMQQMLENLRAGRPQMQQGNSANEMSEALNQLGEMIRRQRELMDQSFRMDQDSRGQRGEGQPQQGQRNGQNRSGQPQPGEPGQNGQQGLAEQLAEALRQLQQGQGDLRQSLEELLQQLERDGVRGNEALGDAGRAMGRAESALGEGEPGDAVQPQGQALESLQQGARSLMEQMIQQGQGQGTAQGPSDPNNTDPLGRPQPNPTREDDGRGVEIPDVIDTQRARDILRELRRKLEDPLRSEIERNYFERLLTPY